MTVWVHISMHATESNPLQTTSTTHRLSAFGDITVPCPDRCRAVAAVSFSTVMLASGEWGGGGVGGGGGGGEESASEWVVE